MLHKQAKIEAENKWIQLLVSNYKTSKKIQVPMIWNRSRACNNIKFWIYCKTCYMDQLEISHVNRLTMDERALQGAWEMFRSSRIFEKIDL